MPQFLLELLTEEIPARMQAKAAADLDKALVQHLTDAGFAPGGVRTLAGPRRLTAVVDGLPLRSEDVREERKGPRVGAPDKAIAGFLRGAGLESLDQCETRADKKGERYVAVIERPGREAADVLAEIVPAIVRGFSWPKSMRWGEGRLRWVRPLQRIVAVLDGAVVPFDIDGLESGAVTEGHRVMGRGPFTVTGWDDYAATLEGEGRVRLDAAERAALIEREAIAACEAAGLELVDDKGLLAEVAGLAEWPVVIMGDMDPAFLDLPPEVIRLSMRTHQKYFAVRDPKTGALAPKFIVVANQIAPDGGAAIAAGNARVLSARLNDARFFWDNDLRTPLADMAGRLGDIVFHQKLGTIADKTARVARLARKLAEACAADQDLAERAARLAKADLVSEMVYEFPELQGVMGRYYALAEAGLDPLKPTGTTKKAKDARAVADAVRDHYKPQGPADAVPGEPVAMAVALADKLDTLSGFWSIGEKPTGSGDPFALRRAALGVIRIVLDGDVRLGVLDVIAKADAGLAAIGMRDAHGIEYGHDLLSFFADRLKVHLRDEGLRHDVIDAVFAPNPSTGVIDDDLVRVTNRARALQAFLASDDGTNLLAGYKRAANILNAEAKKDGAAATGAPDPALFDQGAEQELHDRLAAAQKTLKAAMDDEDFTAAMAALSPLRASIDRFFDDVTVNAENADVRLNRLLLLSQFRDAFSGVGDLSKLEG